MASLKDGWVAYNHQNVCKGSLQKMHLWRHLVAKDIMTKSHNMLWICVALIFVVF